MTNRMGLNSRTGLTMALALALSACGSGKDKAAPTGQVVATLNGDEITVADVQAEIGDPTQSGNPAAQSEALQRIVARKLLAAEAKRRELDSTPLAAIMKARAEEDALAQLLSRKVLEGSPAISNNEVQEFLRTYPASITQRRILNVDSLLVPKASAEVVEQLKGATTLDEAQAILTAKNVKFQKSGSMMDTLALDPVYAQRLVDTEGQDIFIIPQGSALQIGRINSSRIEPLTGADAESAARILLARKRSSELVSQTLGKIVQEGQKQVKLNPAYQSKQANAAAVKP